VRENARVKFARTLGESENPLIEGTKSRSRVSLFPLPLPPSRLHALFSATKLPEGAPSSWTALNFVNVAPLDGPMRFRRVQPTEKRTEETLFIFPRP